MPIDYDLALGAAASNVVLTWDLRDVLLYHLSLGAGRSGSLEDQQWVYEDGLRVLPTFALVAGQVFDPLAGVTAVARPGLDIDLTKVLHAGQHLSIDGPIPTGGQAVAATRVADVWDKGSAAVVVLETVVHDEGGQRLWTSTSQIWARGEGGFGGPPAPQKSVARTTGTPDLTVQTTTSPQSGLLYRLNGDSNPLHADPAFARAAGFDRPILHGLASYGIVCRAVIDSVFDGDADRLREFEVRFAGTIVPGETLETRIWLVGEMLFLSAHCVERDHAPVLSHAWMRITDG